MYLRSKEKKSEMDGGREVIERQARDWKGTYDGSSGWFSAIGMGDLDSVPSSWP